MDKRIIRLLKALHDNERVAGATHSFYKYPARFSPTFVREAITSFTSAGDIVVDPFMGSATTLVEAQHLHRSAFGVDVSNLAVFLAQVKTSLFSSKDVASVHEWATSMSERKFRLTERERKHRKEINLHGTAWRAHALASEWISGLNEIPTERGRSLARCVLLKTFQWALDSKKTIPSTIELRQRLVADARKLCAETSLNSAKLKKFAKKDKPAIRCSHGSASQVSNLYPFKQNEPKLILTSPPYPGVHVLYHRWQVQGRRETAAPFWISGTTDGHGPAYYTLGGRHQKGLHAYFTAIESAFRDIRRLCSKHTVVIQLVAFNEPHWQLDRYMQAMKSAGFDQLCNGLGEQDFQRQVPNRKWYAVAAPTQNASTEYLLIHKPD